MATQRRRSPTRDEDGANAGDLHDAGVRDDHEPLRDLGAYIRSQREQAKLSLRKLAKLAGVSNPYLSQIERGLRNPSAEILQAIARGLEISSETLYVQAGILDPEHEERTDVETAIARARELTEPQRNTLLEMYRSFRRLAALDAGRDPDTTAGHDDGARAGDGAEADVGDAVDDGNTTSHD